MMTPHDTTHDATAHHPPPPWDLALYTSAYTDADHSSPDDARRHADDAWHRLLAPRPLLYLPDRTPHGDCDARIDGHHNHRQLWHRDELLAFDAVVEQRTQRLLLHQQAVLHHWCDAATRIQCHVRSWLGRRRVQRMRQQLYDAAQVAMRARELAALRQRQLHAALRIQTVYHRHCTHLRYLFTCRLRLQRSMRRYVLRWQRARAARRLQRAYRQFRRRVALAAALRTLLRLLRQSRQRAELEAAALVFHKARQDARARAQQQRWNRHPREMATAARVQDRKVTLRALPPLVRTSSAVVLPSGLGQSAAVASSPLDTRLPRLTPPTTRNQF